MSDDPTLPTPVARDYKGRGRPGQLGTVLLPTPLATDGDKGSPKQRSSSGAPLLPGAVLNLMPTPTAALGTGGQTSRGGDRSDEPLLSGLAVQMEIDWGKYEAAIRRWEAVLDRPAPEPTEIGPRGNKRLSPVFVEWMMGLEPGWVTEFPFARKHLFRILGNGVVPQQAVLAITGLIAEELDGAEFLEEAA
jgi:DNA (cytosine-5)-methyltransferase 1